MSISSNLERRKDTGGGLQEKNSHSVDKISLDVMTSKLHKSMSNMDTIRREQIAALTTGEEIDKVLGIHKIRILLSLSLTSYQVILNDMSIFMETGMCTHTPYKSIVTHFSFCRHIQHICMSRWPSLKMCHQ